MSVLPSASQSPVTGRSCSVPSFAHKSPSSHRPLPLRSRNHWPSTYTPMSVTPSPLKSPVTGMAFSFPKMPWRWVTTVLPSRIASVHVARSSGVLCQLATSVCDAVSWNVAAFCVMLRGQPAFTTLKCHVYPPTSSDELITLGMLGAQICGAHKNGGGCRASGGNTGGAGGGGGGGGSGGGGGGPFGGSG